MSDEGFRLPGSPYEDLANIIVAYGTRDEASNPGDVSKLDIVHQSSVSRNNAFLISIGVLAGGREKYVTEQGRSLALALARKDRATIQRKWRELVSREEFMQNVLSAVKLREGIFPSTLQAYIAHYAGQPRNNPVMTGASAIIGILKAADLLREEAGMLVANYDEDPAEPPKDTPKEPIATARPDQDHREEAAEDSEESRTRPGAEGVDRAAARDDARAGDLEDRSPQTQLSFSTSAGVSTVSEEATANGTGGTGITVHVHVNCDPEELEELAPKIKGLLRELESR